MSHKELHVSLKWPLLTLKYSVLYPSSLISEATQKDVYQNLIFLTLTVKNWLIQIQNAHSIIRILLTEMPAVPKRFMFDQSSLFCPLFP